MVPISLVVITLNEEKNIKKCIESFPDASEVIVIDSHSSDKTVEIAKKLGAKVIVRDWPGYAKQKQFATEQASNSWVLLLDADEFLSPELLQEIRQVFQKEPNCDAFEVKRKEIFLGRLISNAKGLSWPVRLYNKSKGHYNEKIVHESFVVSGKIGSDLKNSIHHAGEGAILRVEKILRDAKLESLNKTQIIESNFGVKKLFFDPLIYFFSYLIKKRAYKDGVEGVILLSLFTFQMFLQNVVIYEKSKRVKG